MGKQYWKMVAALLCGLSAWGSDAAAQTITDEARLTKHVWSGYWWPTAKEEILTPLAKFDKLVGANSVAWEKENNPSAGAPSWAGLCHGWAAAALMEEEPTGLFAARRDDRQESLSVADQKAWLSLAHGGDVANFYGRRYNGEGDDRADMAPEVLWEALRTTIKEQKIGLVIDVEPGEAVWNFPAYAYRVECSRVEGNLCRGKMYIWLASDQVEPNFVGVQKIIQAYQFEIETTDDGAPIVGTGRWIGAAEKTHPDFAWTPYLVRSGNDELPYETVCELLKRRPATSVPAPELASNDGGNGEVPSVEENAPAEETADNLRPTAASADLEELLYAVKARGNSFTLDINAEGMQRMFAVGEELRVSGVSEESGYLHLIAFTAENELVWLYPQPGDDARVEAKKVFTIPKPDAPYSFVCTEPAGYTRIYAIVSERPINFDAGEASAARPGEKKKLSMSSLTTMRTPSEKSLAEWLEARTDEEKARIVKDVEAAYGRFSCDQELIHVVKESQTKD